MQSSKREQGLFVQIHDRQERPKAFSIAYLKAQGYSAKEVLAAWVVYKKTPPELRSLHYMLYKTMKTGD